jgi:hypothetical protein
MYNRSKVTEGEERKDPHGVDLHCFEVLTKC